MNTEEEGSEPTAAESEDTEIVVQEEVLVDSGPMPDADIRHNLKAIVLLDVIWAMGAKDIQLAMKPLLVYLGASNFLIGVITHQRWVALIGMFLTPWITRRFPRKKWYLFLVNVPYIAAMGILGFVVLESRRMDLIHNIWSIKLNLPLGLGVDLTLPFLLMFAGAMAIMHQFFAGFVALPHNEYIAACVPMSHRGRYSGYSHAFGLVMAFGTASLGKWIIQSIPKPMCFGYLFLMAWGIWQSGYVMALFAREKPTPVEKSPKPWSRAMLSAAWNDKGYLRVVMLFSVLGVFTVAGEFIDVYAFKGLKVPLYYKAIFMQIGIIVGIPTYYYGGKIVDRLGPKRIVSWWSFGIMLSYLPVVLIPVLIRFHIAPVWGIYGHIFLGQPLLALWGMADKVLLYGLPKPENRAGHYTLQLMIAYASSSIGGMLMGYILDRVEYLIVFTAVPIMALVCYPLTRWAVREVADDPKAYH